MPKTRSLDAGRIAEAALAVIAGGETLSMRNVAAALGAGVMSLYRHVDGREALEALVVDRVLGALDAAPPPPGPWQARVFVHVARLRGAAGGQPHAVPLVLARGFAAPRLMAWLESLLALLEEGGLPAQEAALAARALASYVIGAIQLEHHGPLQQRAAAVAGAAAAFPRLARAAQSVTQVTPDEAFGRGLDRLVEACASGRRPAL